MQSRETEFNPTYSVAIGPVKVDFDHMTGMANGITKPLGYQEVSILYLLSCGCTLIDDIITRMKDWDEALFEFISSSDAPYGPDSTDVIRHLAIARNRFNRRFPRTSDDSIRTIISNINQKFGPIIQRYGMKRYKLIASDEADSF